ncbi:MAG: cytidylate kinase, partial [Spirochaetes bacterium GWC2_52_13]
MTKEETMRLKGFVVAIDGPAGVGKSTIANMVAQRLGFYFLNSGNFYRTITLAVLEQGQDPKDESAVLEVARQLSMRIVDGRLYADGADVQDRLHTDAVDAYVAQHSAIVELRTIVNTHLRALAAGGLNLVAEGRDITTVVFPEAECKFFLDA